MDIPGLKMFCRAVESGNLTAAAVAVHVTKSVASRRIRALEDDLGVRLLQRTTRGVSPTPEGAAFYERAVKILEDLDDARQALSGDDGPLSGRLRLAAPRAFTDLVMAPAFSQFAAENPALELELALHDQRTDILAGGFDLAFRIARTLDDTSLIARKIADLSNVMVASPAFIDQHGLPQTPDDITDLPCIYYANLSAAKAWQLATKEGPLSLRVSGRLMTNSGEMQRQMVCDGLGIAILPRFFVAAHLADGSVQEILPETPPLSSALYALYPERRHNPVRVKRLINWLHTFMQREDVRAFL